ncbi:MAG: hypothetical protein QM820_15495 [Minicystis sp.]
MIHPTMASATHVVFDPCVPERLEKLGVQRVLCACDTLLNGPSRRNVRAHARAREAWWGAEDDADGLRSPYIRWEPPIVVWVSSNLLDRMNLLRTCSRLRQARIPSREVFVIELGPTPWGGEEPAPRLGCFGSVIDYTDEELSARFQRAHPFRPARYDRAVSLWDKYVDPNPLRFARACAHGVPGFPELAAVWEVLSAYFPRRTARGTLSLSRFDETLLNLLSDEWQTPAALFVQKSPTGKALREFLWCTGDVFLSRRLDDWATFGSAPAVERAESAGLETYRLTEHGLRLRTQPLTHFAFAPRLPVAGATAYAEESPWVLLDDGKLVQG